MEKINIAELLKDCPKGMELYSPLCGKCVFDRLNFGTIICKKQNTQEITFTSKGYYMLPVFDDCECMIFPSKDQRDWSKFEPPCKFKDGDVVATTDGLWIGITTGGEKGKFIPTYCVIRSGDEFKAYPDRKGEWAFNRLATEEEKAKLFDAIKANGYKWNPYTKTLEKLIKPKFKVGDKIIKRDSIVNSWIVSSVSSEYYGLKTRNNSECIAIMSIAEQDEYDLVPDKFDINTLKPFDKVLVRSHNSDVWECDFFSSYNPKCSNRFHCIGAWYNICIPYIGNEHLRGTTNDCDEFYKTWE